MNEHSASLIERSEILPVFPTFLWKFQLRQSVSERINSDVLAKLDSVLQTISPGHGWQSEPN